MNVRNSIGPALLGWSLAALPGAAMASALPAIATVQQDRGRQERSAEALRRQAEELARRAAELSAGAARGGEDAEEIGEKIRAQVERFLPEGGRYEVRVAPGQEPRTFQLRQGLAPFIRGGQGEYRVFMQANTAGTLGLTLEPVGDVLRAHLDLPEGAGLVVTGVEEDGPAAEVIRKNDILLAVGDEELEGADDLAEAVEGSEGEAIAITLIRKGEEQDVELTVPDSGEDDRAPMRYYIGVTIDEPAEAVREQLELEEDRGLVVMQVRPDGPAEKAGVERRDILITLADEPVTTPEALTATIQEVGDREIEVVLLRKGAETTVTLTPEKSVAPPAPPAPPAAEFFGPGVIVNPGQPPAAPATPRAPRNLIVPDVGRFREQAERAREQAQRLRQELEGGQLEELREQIEALREEIEAMKKRRGGRGDDGDDDALRAA